MSKQLAICLIVLAAAGAAAPTMAQNYDSPSSAEPDTLPPPGGSRGSGRNAEDSWPMSPSMIEDLSIVPQWFENAPAEAAAQLEDPDRVWYDPWSWARPVWDGSVELGINGSAGNAESFSFRAGADLTRDTPENKWELNVKHARTTARSVETQNNALGSLRYEHLFGTSPWSLFATSTGEYDEFKAFDFRWASNAGIGYKFINLEHLKLAGRFGSGVSREVGGPDERFVPEAVFAIDYKHKWTERQKFYAKAEYFPDWADFDSFRMVVDGGWEILLDPAIGMSLKIGVIDRYDSTPNGRKPNDIDYSLLLLWNL